VVFALVMGRASRDESLIRMRCLFSPQIVKEPCRDKELNSRVEKFEARAAPAESALPPAASMAARAV
jgi:hypothetical protein